MICDYENDLLKVTSHNSNVSDTNIHEPSRGVFVALMAILPLAMVWSEEDEQDTVAL